jgi:hypothetical protein
VHRCGRYDRGRYGLYRYSGLHYDGRYNRGYGSHRYHGLGQYWGIVLSWHSRGYYYSVRYIGVSRFLISAVS